jgi:hypothetical protein
MELLPKGSNLERQRGNWALLTTLLVAMTTALAPVAQAQDTSAFVHLRSARVPLGSVFHPFTHHLQTKFCRADVDRSMQAVVCLFIGSKAKVRIHMLYRKRRERKL